MWREFTPGVSGPGQRAERCEQEKSRTGTAHFARLEPCRGYMPTHGGIRMNGIRGRVISANPGTRRVAVRTETGNYAVLDLRGDFRVETGHLISGGLDSPGVKTVHNETTWEELDIRVLATRLRPGDVKRFL